MSFKKKSCFRNKSLCSCARFGLEQIRDRTDKSSGTFVLSALFRFRARCAVSLSPCSLRATAKLNKFAGTFYHKRKNIQSHFLWTRAPSQNLKQNYDTKIPTSFVDVRATV
jgi:hypothetical protein